MAKKYVIDGREVIGWITRGGKRVPIFEKDDDITPEDMSLVSVATGSTGNIDEKIQYRDHDILVFYGYEMDRQKFNSALPDTSTKRKFWGAIVGDWDVSGNSFKKFKSKPEVINWIKREIDSNDD